MSSCSAWRWVTSAMGPLASTAALSAATLLSRPTWSGTIISGKITVSRSATSGSSRTSRAVVSGSGDGVDGRLAISGSPWVPACESAYRFGCLVSCGWGTRSRGVRTAVRAGPRGADAALRRAATSRCVSGPFTGSFVVQGLEDPLAQALLELEQGLDPGEVDAAVTGEVTDPQDPPDVLFRVQADVGRRARRADQALVLVDAQRPGVRGDERRRHADDVDGPGGIPVGPARCRHGLCLGLCAVPGHVRPGARAGPDGLGLAARHRGDPDLLRLDLLGLRDAQLEDAVLERCLGLVCLEPRRQGHGAHHAAARDLADHPALLLASPPGAVLGADGQGAVLEGDVDVVGRDARERGLDEQGVRRRAHVEGQASEVALVGIGRQRPEDGVVEQAVHRPAERHELAEGRRSTGQRHESSLLLYPAAQPSGLACLRLCRRVVWSPVERWLGSPTPDTHKARTLTMVLSRYVRVKGHKPCRFPATRCGRGNKRPAAERGSIRRAAPDEAAIFAWLGPESATLADAANRAAGRGDYSASVLPISCSRSWTSLSGRPIAITLSPSASTVSARSGVGTPSRITPNSEQPFGTARSRATRPIAGDPGCRCASMISSSPTPSAARCSSSCTAMSCSIEPRIIRVGLMISSTPR